MIPLNDLFKSDKYSWILILALFTIVLEIIFADWGFLFPAVLFGALFYYGRKNRSTRKGKLAFWIGVIGLIFTVLHMLVFKFIVIALFVFVLIDFIRSKQQPRRIQPEFGEQINLSTDQASILPNLLNNNWFGAQETPSDNYEWQDINIQSGVGDALIDLSHTLLPKGESVIMIRHIAGRIRILVPYGVEVSLRASIIFGQVDFLNRSESRLINESIAFQTDHYADSDQKVKVVISTITGHVEVRRI